MLDGFVDASKILEETLNELKLPPSFFTAQMKTMLELVKSSIPGEKLLKEEKNRDW